MSKRHFSILLLVTVVVAVAVFLVPRPTGRDAMTEPSAFLPELASVVNDVATVRVSMQGGSEVVTLERRDDGWVVREFHAYPADWGVLRPLLADLSQAEMVEEKTSNPEYYHRLGVEDLDAEGSQSKLIEFPGMDELPGIVIGNRAQGRDGQYLRRLDEARAVLVDRAITLPLEGSGWLNREIVDVPDDEVVAVRVTHSDGESIEIERNSTDVTDFTLEGIPQGRTTRSAWTINQLASTLSALTLDAVAPVDEVSWDEAIEVEVRTQDDLQVVARFAEDGEDRWVRIQASGTGDAEAINQRVDGWAYRIPLYKFDSVNKRMDDLLAEPEDEQDTE